MRRACRRLTVLALGFVLSSVVIWEVVRRQGQAPDRMFAVALVALKQNDLTTVDRCLQALRHHSGYQSHCRLLSGAVLLGHNQPEAALREFLGLDPRGEIREPALRLTGECLYRLERAAEAEGLFRRLVVESPSNTEAYRWLFRLYHERGALNDALEVLEVWRRVSPKDFWPYRLIAGYHLDFNEFPEAIEFYEEALRLNPPPEERQRIQEELGQALVEVKDYQRALKELEQAEANAAILTLRSECHIGLGNLDAAGAGLRQARELAPNNSKVLLLTAQCYRDSGQIELAVPLWQQVLRQDEHDREARYQLALAFQRQGRLSDYQREMQLKAAADELHDRHSDLNKQVTEHPLDAALREKLAEVCDRLGKPQQAAAWRRAADVCRQLAKPNPQLK